MRIFLDTTYILPLFGLDVDIHNFDFKQLLEKNILYLSNISLLEVKYLISRHYRKMMKNTKVKDINILQRYEIVLPTVVNHPNINIIDSLIEPEISKIANDTHYNGHKDMLDCMILGTAIFLRIDMLSEDESFPKICENNNIQYWNWKKLYNEINS